LNGELKNRIDEKLKDKTTLMYLLTSTGYQQLWDFVLCPALEEMWNDFPDLEKYHCQIKDREPTYHWHAFRDDLFNWIEKWRGKT